MSEKTIHFIKSIEEASKFPKADRVEYNCTKCRVLASSGVEHVLRKNRLLCTKCATIISRQEFMAKKNSMTPEELLRSRSFKYITSLDETKDIPGCKFVTFNCTKCGKLAGNDNIRLREKGLLLCGDCMKKHTNMERFGYESAAQRPEAREKASKFNLEHKDEINEARRLAIQAKYGVDNVMQVQEHKTACLESNRNNHGGILAQQTEELRKTNSERMIENHGYSDRATATNIANHGGVHSLALPENREKLYEYQRTHKNDSNKIRDMTNINKFGKSNYMAYGSPEHNAMQFIKFIKEYGQKFLFDIRSHEDRKNVLVNECKIPQEVIFNLDKLSEYIELNKDSLDWKSLNTIKYQTMYNTTHPISKPLCFDGIIFDSKWELEYYLHECDAGKKITREPRSISYTDDLGRKHKYTPDFEVDGELVEIKGPQFFKNRNANDLYCPYDSDEKLQTTYKALGETIQKENVKVISAEEMKPYVDYVNQNYDMSYINSLYLSQLMMYAFSRFTFKPLYCNSLNGGKGATPFDLKSDDEYTSITDKGITPFDIMIPKD